MYVLYYFAAGIIKYVGDRLVKDKLITIPIYCT